MPWAPPPAGSCATSATASSSAPATTTPSPRRCAPCTTTPSCARDWAPTRRATWRPTPMPPGPTASPRPCAVRPARRRLASLEEATRQGDRHCDCPLPPRHAPTADSPAHPLPGRARDRQRRGRRDQAAARRLRRRAHRRHLHAGGVQEGARRAGGRLRRVHRLPRCPPARPPGRPRRGQAPIRQQRRWRRPQRRRRDLRRLRLRRPRLVGLAERGAGEQRRPPPPPPPPAPQRAPPRSPAPPPSSARRSPGSASRPSRSTWAASSCSPGPWASASCRAPGATCPPPSSRSSACSPRPPSASAAGGSGVVSSHAASADPRSFAGRLALPRVAAEPLATLAFGAVLAAIALEGGGGLQLGPVTRVELAVDVVAGALTAAAIVAGGHTRRLWGALTLTLMTLLVAVTAASITWAVEPSGAWVEANRTLSYLATMVAGVALVRLFPQRWSSLLGGVVLASVAVCGYALLTKVFPGSLNADEIYARLREPFGYWNAVGLMAAAAGPACLWLGGRGRGGGAPGGRPARPSPPPPPRPSDCFSSPSCSPTHAARCWRWPSGARCGSPSCRCACAAWRCWPRAPSAAAWSPSGPLPRTR